MNKNKLILEEILWEITTECNKSCSYCGSKGLKQTTLNKDQLFQIVDNIIEANPSRVTITGGEPTVIYDKLIDCITRLKAGGIKEIGIVTNGKEHLHDLILNKDINTIGLSINTIEDIKHYEDWFESDCQDGDQDVVPDICKAMGPSGNLGSYFPPRGKITIVTNFGSHNIWDFDKLFKFMVDANGFWQIQLTMGEYQLNADGIKHLYKKIKENLVNCKEVGYVLSDNLQHEHTCTAGFNSCSITHDGTVIGCLSKRAWDNDGIESKNNKNLFSSNGLDIRVCDSLMYIWTTNFTDERFCKTCQSCRDQIDYPELEDSDRVPTMKLRGDGIPSLVTTTTDIDDWNKTPTPKKEPIMLMYGIISEPFPPSNSYPTFDPFPLGPYEGTISMYAVISEPPNKKYSIGNNTGNNNEVA